MPFRFGLPAMRAGRPRSWGSGGCTRMDRARINAATAGILLRIRITLPEVAWGLVYERPDRFSLKVCPPLAAERGDRGGYFCHRDRGRAKRRAGDGARRANRGRRA